MRDTGRLVVGATVGHSRIGPMIRVAIGVGTPGAASGGPADVTTVALALPVPRELAEKLQQALPEEGLQLSRPLGGRAARKPQETPEQSP